jgi:hypothetical protein
MAVAARPGPPDARDARVPCPLCGGLIHPIAGKCKHCKADLSSYRSARPAASTPLPALQPPARNGHASARNGYAPQATAAPASPASAVGPGGGGAPAGPVGTMVAAAREATQPVLPPRPTAMPYATEPTRSAWRSWPVAVIALAIAAIVAALVMMAWPANRGAQSSARPLPPPPAPERMQTEPEVKQPSLGTQIAPPPGPGAAPDRAVPGAPRDPDPDPAESDPDSSGAAGASPADPGRADPGHSAAIDPLGPLVPSDPASPPGPGGPSAGRSLGASNAVMMAMFSHVCRRLLQCGASDDDVATTMCDALARAPGAPPPHCPAADRCLHHIDAMSCGDQSATLAKMNLLLTQVRDCADAMTQC